MHDDPIASQADSDGLVAEVYQAAINFALRQGFRGTFIEVQRGLLDALRACAGRGSTGDLRNPVERSGWDESRAGPTPAGSPPMPACPGT